jgi:hypothetical protein
VSTPSDPVAIAEAFTDGMNRRDHEAAAALLDDDVEVVLPGGSLRGRAAWLESRQQQPPPDELSEEVVADELTPTDGGVELRGRLVQRWVESGDVAHKMPVLIVFAIEDGLISRLELRPG